MRQLRVPLREIANFDNLREAWRSFRRGKGQRRTVRAFERNLDVHLHTLKNQLASETYRPSGFDLKVIREPKLRLIAAAPVRDRVVHHAIYRKLAPWLDESLIETTFACLNGRGSHRALLAFLGAQRRFRFRLMLDIRHYFLSIDHSILLDLLRRRFRDRKVVGLCQRILESGEGLYHADIEDPHHGLRRVKVADVLGLPPGFPPPGVGIPIGNLTSQWWANHYLSGFDHFVKRELRLPHYQRYMDDLACFSDDEAALEEAREKMQRWLATERHLRLKHPQALVRPTSTGADYLGYHVRRDGIYPRTEIYRRFQVRIMDAVRVGATKDIERVVDSYLGILRFPIGGGKAEWEWPTDAELGWVGPESP